MTLSRRSGGASLPSRTLAWQKGDGVEPLLAAEWIVTNGLGGYAAGTVSGAPTRRFHGLLIASLPAPQGRSMMLNHLVETVRTESGSIVSLGGVERASGIDATVGAAFRDFRLEGGLPVWRFDVGEHVLEKRVVLPHMQNTAFVSYRLISPPDAHGRTLRLQVRPAVSFRPHEGRLDGSVEGYALLAESARYELRGAEHYPPLRMRFLGPRASFTLSEESVRDVLYRVERARGYDAVGDLHTPGYFRADIGSDADVVLVVSTESWETVQALTPRQANDAELVRRERLIERARQSTRPPARRHAHPLPEGPSDDLRQTVDELVLAADEFLITPGSRIVDAARAHAWGDEVRTVIAGYHWFTDWGRDTMISLEGLTLATGRYEDAGYILRTFAKYVQGGLIPNMFPEGECAGLYHTADATLWFFHAIDRYLDATGDRTTLRLLLPVLREIVDAHLRGTHFGIGVDPEDGLLRQGQEGYQLTWMDAKMGDWIVTPRRGKAVEINALFYNALSLFSGWVAKEDSEAAAAPFREAAARVRASFNERFWYPEGGHLYDVVDGPDGKDDAACRPNQLFAISLPHPVLARERWTSVMDVVDRELLTPVGLRSLSPKHPDYRPSYDGDLASRDGAYHQGTVWAWLIGPFVDAWHKVRPGELTRLQQILHGFSAHLGEACLGSVSEIFDAEPPFAPRGCVSQAWSVAEGLRAAATLERAREPKSG